MRYIAELKSSSTRGRTIGLPAAVSRASQHQQAGGELFTTTNPCSNNTGAPYSPSAANNIFPCSLSRLHLISSERRTRAGAPPAHPTTSLRTPPFATTRPPCCSLAPSLRRPDAPTLRTCCGGCRTPRPPRRQQRNAATQRWRIASTAAARVACRWGKTSPLNIKPLVIYTNTKHP